MTGLVYIEASAPWGPVRIGAAVSLGAMLRQVAQQPAHVEDVGALDPEAVAVAARVLLGPAGAGGWIGTRVEAAQKAVLDARARISATPVAAKTTEPSHASPDARDEGVPLAGVELCKNPAKGGVSAQVENRVLGVSESLRTATVTDLDVRAIRAGYGMTQAVFARAFGLPLATLRDWEQGRNTPDQAARVLLAVIGCRPDAVREALRVYG